MNSFVMLVGLPASGKSYYASALEKHGYIIHSSDNLREELYGDASIQKDNPKLFLELHRRIKQDLKSGKNVVFDATNISYKKRMSFLNEIKNIDCYKICSIMATPIKECILRNSNRDRKVPVDVIYKMREHFNFPAYFEGWNNISILFNYDSSIYNGYTFESIYDYTRDFKQDNPHHSLTLYEHLLKTRNHIEHRFPDRQDLIVAAYMHDIGKLYTKKFQNAKGEKTDIAHYYNHQNVSSYESMLYLSKGLDFGGNKLVKICTLIQWHMQPYFNNTNKSTEKYKRLWGEELFNDLMKLHEADKYAH